MGERRMLILLVFGHFQQQDGGSVRRVRFTMSWRVVGEDSCGGFIGDMDYMISDGVQPFVERHL